MAEKSSKTSNFTTTQKKASIKTQKRAPITQGRRVPPPPPPKKTTKNK